MLDPLILRIISVGFALLFIFAAAHKFNNKLQFLGILEAYQMRRFLYFLSAWHHAWSGRQCDPGA